MPATLVPRALRLSPLLLAAVMVAVAAIAATGTRAAIAVGAAAGFGAALAAWGRAMRRAGADTAIVARIAMAALLLVPGLEVVLLSFSSGGFFPDGAGVAALALLLLLVLRCSLAPAPFVGLGARAAVPLAGLALLAGWSLLSGRWSHAAGRALVEFDRNLLYLAAFGLFASLGVGAGRLRIAVRGVAAALVVVAGAALVSRVAPDVLDPGYQFSQSRLSYPVTYWNALGAMCALGIVLCAHLSADLEERAVVRVLAAGALPVLATTLLLTFSRGAVAAVAVGVVAYLLVGRPRGTATAFVAAAVPTLIAVRTGYDATLLGSATPTSPAAVAQGHDLARTVAGCAVVALALRAVLLALDGQLRRLRLPDRLRRPVTAGAWTAAAVAAVVAALALHLPGAAHDKALEFAHQRTVGATTDVRDRFSSGSAQGRMEHWRVALEAFRDEPVHGQGAGTYGQYWLEHRRSGGDVIDAHSLYLEVLGELGIPGLLAVILIVGGMLVATAPVGRGRQRPLHAVVFAVVLTWSLHAAVDWDWEMPALTLGVIALAGLAAARRRQDTAAEAGGAGDEAVTAAQPTAAPPSVRRLLVPAAVGLAALAVGVVPTLLVASQVRVASAADAVGHRDCSSAEPAARRAADLVPQRGEPWQILGLCAAQSGRYDLAAADLRTAVARDGRNATYVAELAAATTAAGGHGSGILATALRLHPRDPSLQALQRRIAPHTRDRRRAAREYLAREHVSQR